MALLATTACGSGTHTAGPAPTTAPRAVAPIPLAGRGRRRAERAHRLGHRGPYDRRREHVLRGVVPGRSVARLHLGLGRRALDRACRRHHRPAQARDRGRLVRMVSALRPPGPPGEIGTRARRPRRSRAGNPHVGPCELQLRLVTRRDAAGGQRARRHDLPRPAPHLLAARAGNLVPIATVVRTHRSTDRSRHHRRRALLRPHRGLATRRRRARRLVGVAREQRAARRRAPAARSARRNTPQAARRHGRATGLGALVARRETAPR